MQSLKSLQAIFNQHECPPSTPSSLLLNTLFSSFDEKQASTSISDQGSRNLSPSSFNAIVYKALRHFSDNWKTTLWSTPSKPLNTQPQPVPPFLYEAGQAHALVSKLSPNYWRNSFNTRSTRHCNIQSNKARSQKPCLYSSWHDFLLATHKLVKNTAILP